MEQVTPHTRQWMRGTSTPLKGALLGLLLERPSHGYGLASRLDARLGPAWRIERQSLYRLLDQLESAGLVRHVIEPVPDSPRQQRAVYYPTELAQEARNEWFAAPPAKSVVRADIYARLALSSEEDAPGLLRALHEYRIQLLEAIEENAATETKKVSWLGMVINLSRAAVDKRLRAEVDWISEVRLQLESAIDSRSST